MLALLPTSAWTQAKAPTLASADAAPQATTQTHERRASQTLERARQQGPLALRAFFVSMPKGADLHNHLSGAVYAETFIQDAVDDNLCVKVKTLTFYKAMAMTRSLPPQPVCGEDGEPAATALKDENLYDALIDAFSMRIFVPTVAESGHDHFFASFEHFGASALEGKHLAEWLDEVASRAAKQNEQYMELMHTPNFKAAAALGETLGPIDIHSDFNRLAHQLLDQGLRADLPAMRAEFDGGESGRREIERCGQSNAFSGCTVEVRYLYQVLRALPPQLVFAQLVAGFELASTDPLIVGINMVQPEDWRVSMADYSLHMKMVGALHALYPKVHISLHAGELGPGMVAPAGLTFHIRSAVEDAHAERIGHGVDVLYEENPYGLLKELAAERVMVEINLTSNDVILNVKGADHPLPLYRQYHVPVALSTDDEGVSRIDLTHEYVRAALAYPLTYADFKQMVRTSLEHSFLPGDSLWTQAGPFEGYDHPRAACRAQLGREEASGTCASFLASSEKARQQFALEYRFERFENTF